MKKIKIKLNADCYTQDLTMTNEVYFFFLSECLTWSLIF